MRVSLIGEPGYPEGFAHFNYVNPDAPKGGTLRLSAVSQTFDTLNPILDKGVIADGLGLIYESLMMRALDEADISAEYGEIADALRYPADYSYVTYRINPKAKWHDGEPITPDDVVWSFDETVKLNQSQRYYYQHVTKAEVTAPDQVTFIFDQKGNRELPEIVGELTDPAQALVGGHRRQRQQARHRQGHAGAAAGLRPLPHRRRAGRAARSPTSGCRTSGARTSTSTSAATTSTRSATSTTATSTSSSRRSRPTISTTGGRTRPSAGRPPTTSRRIKDGKVKKEEVKLDQVSGVMVGFVPNLRRPFFQDRRVRRALNYAFDFEELNRTIFYGQYQRINSFFFGLPLAASGLPKGKELEILNAVKDEVPPEVFTTPYENPVGGTRRRCATTCARRSSCSSRPATR